MELETAASTIEVSDSGIVIRWSDGARSRFHSLWLRDNCPTAVTVTDLNPDVWVMDAFRNDDGDLAIEFSDGHETSFGFDWIRAHSHEPHDRLGRSRLVSHVRAGHELERFDEPSLASKELLDVFESVSKFGAAVIAGASTGNLPMFHATPAVVVERDDLVLTPHTDDPYRYVPPAITALQSPSSAGEVILVDGFGVANDLRDEDPDVFDTLSETSIPFRGQGESAQYLAHGPIISLDRDYELSGIRFDETAIAPLDLDPGTVGDYYRSLISFTGEVNNPARALLVHLEPGDVLLLDNHRLLHGLSGFERLHKTTIQRDEFHRELRELRQAYERPNVDERFASGPRP